MMDFVFERAAWEAAIDKIEEGGSISAAQLLTLLEGVSEEDAEEALALLEQRRIALTTQDLPPAPLGGEAALRLRLEQQLVQKGSLPGGLEENDPLRLYLEEVALTPAFGDPQLLAQQYLDGDESVVTQLTNLMLSKVIGLAKEMTGKGVLLLDLIQEGSLGLWQGILSYAGGDFESHVSWWIRQYLAKAVTQQARAMGVGQKLRSALEDYRDVDQRLLSELGRNPTAQEIAQQLHIEPEDAEVLEKMLQTARTLQQAKAEPEKPEIPEEEDQAVEDTAYFQLRQRIQELLSGLSETDAKILSLRYGLEGGLPLNPQQTGEKLGLTAQEVIQKEAAALSLLRQQQ